ncbi:hypothetical protein J2Z19_003608 [Ensifer adhaerens]|uniref:Uncharacterized protein n=1 Tax=Ensifer adhaerens TaxID=106592 RepID=A0ACC5SYZ7_ENSAD|nr:hypothetical protein [Ensifer adhaerens]MBP1873889.1 hypothetical protein [Ensifer adhaerens]
MTSRPLGCICAIVLALFSSSATAALAAGACPKVNYATEYAKLQKVMSKSAFPRDEQAFLLGGVERQLSDLSQRQLNVRGQECGTKAVRAHVIGCVNATLLPALGSIRSPGSKSGKALWGKANVSRREAITIGMFDACRLAAMDTFVSGP